MQKNKKTKNAGPVSVKRKKMALGKGLGALIPDIETEQENKKEYFYCDTDLIRPNRFQPRRRFTDEDLAELAESIKSQGILQPLLVRQDETGYELITGERRLRAAKHAGLTQVPVLIKRVNNDKLLEMALVENIQREDLNPLEEANALQRLIDDFDLTHMQVAEAVGRSRVAVSNLLRLLELAEPVKELLNKSLLSMGHARAMLALAEHDQPQIARLVVNRGLSVRETEALIKKHLAPHKPKPQVSEADPNIQRLEQQISDNLCAQVKIKTGKKGDGQMLNMDEQLHAQIVHDHKAGIFHDHFLDETQNEIDNDKGHEKK